ncbi:MAG: hypothetical protein V8S14_00860 [Lachnospiraceae bacterium]
MRKRPPRLTATIPQETVQRKIKGEEETAYTYNGLNQLLKAKTTKGDTVKNDISYEYDVNGNQIKETDRETGDSVENTSGCRKPLKYCNCNKEEEKYIRQTRRSA